MKLFRRRALVIMTLVFLAAGCHSSEQGSDLADSGVQASTNLQAFYTSLADTVEKTADLEAFNSSLRGVAFDPSSSDDTVKALRARAAMARQMTQTYKSLAALAKYDASKEVGTAASDLTTAVQKLPKMPAAVDISPIVNGVAGKLASAKQDRDLTRDVQSLLATLTAITEVFAKEDAAYTSVGEEYANKATIVSSYLLDQGIASPQPLLSDAASALNLTWTKQNFAMTDEPSKKAIKALMSSRAARLNKAVASATTTQESALTDLLQAEKAFVAKQPFDASIAKTEIDFAGNMVDELRKLLTAKTQAGGVTP